MKIICVCGGDGLGKNTLIENIAKFYNLDNVHIRHLGKPPKKFPEGITPFEFQKTCFYKEGNFLEYINKMELDEPYNYYENVVIFNRFIWGEFVYGQMFRKTDPKEIKTFLNNFESTYLYNDPILILLTADPEFFLDKEDGQSFSKNIEDKTKELELFDQAFDNSMILNKIRIKVNKEDQYKPKEEIFEIIKAQL